MPENHDLKSLIRCGMQAHGHACPPLVLGVRAGFAAMSRLGVGRALDRELFALVELGSDHYAQGFVDGVQVATGCTFGKDLILRIPHGKASVRLVHQASGRAVRVVSSMETIDRIELSEWFRTCSSAGSFASGCTEAAGPLIDELLAVPEETLFTVGPVFPLSIEDPPPEFETRQCAACGESVLSRYTRELGGRTLCVTCLERCRDRSR